MEIAKELHYIQRIGSLGCTHKQTKNNVYVIIKDSNVLCDSLIFPLTLAQKPYLETRPENGWIARQVPVYQQPNHPPQSMTPQVALALLTTPQKVKVKFWKQWVFLFLEFLRVCYYLHLEVQI